MGIKAKDKHGIEIEEEFFGKVLKWVGRDIRKHLPNHPHGIFSVGAANYGFQMHVS